jgi:hypothetical protein
MQQEKVKTSKKIRKKSNFPAEYSLKTKKKMGNLSLVGNLSAKGRLPDELPAFNENYYSGERHLIR